MVDRGEGQDESGKMVKRLMGHSKAFDTLVQVHKEMDLTDWLPQRWLYEERRFL